MADREYSMPFDPLPPGEVPSWSMPASVPAGLRLELSRARLKPGADERFGQWMQELHDRYDEMLPALVNERAVFEATFHHQEADGSRWIYHLSLIGEDGAGLDETVPIDATHAAYSREVKEPGWEELRPELMLTPAHIREVMALWGRTGTAP